MAEANSVSTLGGSLTARLQLAHTTQTGAIQMPATTRHVLIEVGCSDRDTLDQDPIFTEDAASFLISFEPLVDKYAVLLGRGTARFHGRTTDRSVPLGHHHARGVVLPFALSPRGGPTSFHVSKIAGCSSYLDRTDRSWAACSNVREQRTVPSITLADALGLAGSLPVRYLRLDAQGADYALIRATDPGLLRTRVERISMEIVASDCRPLYAGQARCDEVVQYMRSIGFATRNDSMRIHHGRVAVAGCQRWARGGARVCEGDATFYREL